jgi:hypothetical protein
MANDDQPGLEPGNEPERRRYLSLREELDVFMELGKRLNQQVVEKRWEEVQRTKASMRDSLEKIAEAAGQTS